MFTETWRERNGNALKVMKAQFFASAVLKMMARSIFYHLLLVSLSMTIAASANAVNRQHLFSVRGDNGEAGYGFFAWDDAEVPDGHILSVDDLSYGWLSISAGNTPDFVQDFNVTDWGDSATFQPTPDFITSLNFETDNGDQSLTPSGAFTSNTSWGSQLTFIPRVTVPPSLPPPKAVPLFNSPGVILLSLLVVLSGIRRIHSLR